MEGALTMSTEILENLGKAVQEFDQEGAANWAQQAMDGGVDPLAALETLTVTIREIGDAFGRGECFLPELVGAADAMQSAMPIIEAVIDEQGKERESAGKVVVGTVAGDIHNIGKTILCTLLTADGFEVIDLGIDVPLEKFLTVVKEEKPDLLAMSALLTITAQEQKNVIEALMREEIRDEVKIMVGGGAISEQFAEKIGADGYDPTAPGGVALARRLLEA
jgi:corrinoid protein of di/trimethylamine methyltransferase